MNTAAPVRAYVAFGANLGDPAASLRLACARLAQLPGTTVAATSALYRSAPVGVDDQPDYFNAVLALDTTLGAHALLHAMQAIELEGGRERSYQWAPRTMDLDLLLYGDAVIDDAELQVPHPRMHERAFALLPLAEIAPSAHIPGRGGVGELLGGVADQAIERVTAQP